MDGQLILLGGSSAADLRNDVWLFRTAVEPAILMMDASYRIPGRSGHTATLVPGKRELLVYGGGQVGENCFWLLHMGQHRMEWHCLSLKRPLPYLVHHTAVMVSVRNANLRTSSEFLEHPVAAGEEGLFKVHEPLPGGQISFAQFSSTKMPVTSVIAIFGGARGAAEHSNALYLLACDDLSWCQVEARNSPPPMASHTAVMQREMGRMFIYGGRNREEVFDTLYCFDFATMEWTRITPAQEGAVKPGPRAGHTATLVGERFMVILGGWDGFRDETGREMGAVPLDAWILDLETMQWHMKPLRDNEEEYDGENNLIGVPTKPEPRDMHAAALVFEDSLDSQRLFVVGGTDDEFMWLDDAWMLDLALMPPSLVRLSLRKVVRSLSTSVSEKSRGVWDQVLVSEVDCEKQCRFCKLRGTSSTASLLRCSACKTVLYCSVNCQRSDFPVHKLKCSGKRGLESRHVLIAIDVLEKGFETIKSLNLAELLQRDIFFPLEEKNASLSNTFEWLQKRCKVE